MAGALQYLTITRPDISYIVQQICLFIHDPRESYQNLIKRVLPYLKGILALGLQLYSSSSHKIVLIPMPTGLAVRILVVLHRDIVFFLVTISSLGHLDARLPFLVLVQRQSIMQWLMWWWSRVGFDNCYRNFICRSHPLQWYIATISARFIFRPILCNNDTPNILRLTYTLYARRLLLATSECFMCHPRLNTPTFTKGLLSQLVAEFRSNLNVFASCHLNGLDCGGVLEMESCCARVSHRAERGIVYDS